MESIQLSVLASAYNVFGPRSGTPATPSTVLGMASKTDLRRMTGLYLDHTRKEGRDAMFSVETVNATIEAL